MLRIKVKIFMFSQVFVSFHEIRSSVSIDGLQVSCKGLRKSVSMFTRLKKLLSVFLLSVSSINLMFYVKLLKKFLPGDKWTKFFLFFLLK